MTNSPFVVFLNRTYFSVLNRPIRPLVGRHRDVPTEQQQTLPRILQEPFHQVLSTRFERLSEYGRSADAALHQRRIVGGILRSHTGMSMYPIQP